MTIDDAWKLATLLGPAVCGYASWEFRRLKMAVETSAREIVRLSTWKDEHVRACEHQHAEHRQRLRDIEHAHGARNGTQ